MSTQGNDLYRWKRWTKNKQSTSVSKKPASVNDIELWLKKVEQASDEAAAITFGRGRSKVKDFSSNGRLGAVATIDVLKDHDAAYQEAQDLLTQWMADKCNLDEDEDEDYLLLDEEAAEKKQSNKTDLQSHWEQLLDENDPGMLHAYSGPSSEAIFDEIESRDDDRTVQQILEDLLEKDMGEKAVKKDLGLNPDKKKKDPLVTMAARQQKVKENREKKERERKMRLEERQAERDAQLKARQIVKQEEKARAIRQQHEEMKIQQEMASIRKQMQEARHKEEDERKRIRQAEEEARLQMELEEAKRKEDEARRRMEDERKLQMKKDELMKKAVELKAQEEAEKLRIKHRHFKAWYQLVLDNRLKMGKARALSDWRCLLRSWNAWRAFHRACQAERESKEAEIYIKESHRRNQAAHSHYRFHLLRKCFLAWRIWLASQEEATKIEEAKVKTRNKMDAFLEAAASGRLWTERSDDSDGISRRDGKEQQKGSSVQSSSHPASQRSSSSSASSNLPSRSEHTLQSKKPAAPNATTRPSKPKHAWQVTRKHLQLTPEEMVHLGEEDDHLNRNQNQTSVHLDLTSIAESDVSLQMKKSAAVSYKVNNFEHRYANQQKMLMEQRKQLDEQKRLIEDLQAAQREQLIKMQIADIQKGVVTGGSSGSQVATGSSIHQQGDSAIASVPTSARTESDFSIVTATSDPRTTNRSSSSTGSKGGTTRQTPSLLKGMEERAAIRAQKKAEREERQRKREEEHLAWLKSEEERKVAEEEKKKKEEMEKRKEQKRLEKQKELDKKLRLERLVKLNCMADDHYHRYLMRNYGLEPWKKLIATAHQNWQKAVKYHSNQLLRSCLLPWHQITQDSIKTKRAIADEKYEQILLQRSLNSWKRYGHYLSIQYQRARRHYALQTKARLFKAWQDFSTNEKLNAWRYEELSEDFSRKRIMRLVFTAWRNYPKMLKQERDREKRRQEMRKKVSSLLPDFGLHD
ncbi:hypothetical protein HOLleu_21873 [Holothuria leucospilota]|uniref:Uncharacterized protein n=1 Tax=Holothuria leucospilota TaxID=206669 RepID=A0A9Q1H6D5_HOLLE|nr:hypothetical protein HOLleu_21873 [Holothuria leucospilota]